MQQNTLTVHGEDVQSLDRLGGLLAPAFPLLTKDKVKELKEQTELFKEAKNALLTCTNDHDWMDFGGNPYLTDSGIQNLCAVARIEFGAPEVEREKGKDEFGEYINFTCKLTGQWLMSGRRHPDIGTSSTRDAFFGVEGGKFKALAAINVGNVEKKSITNAQHRIVAKLLAIDGVSWEQLLKLGINPPKTAVRFRGHEKKAVGAGVWTQNKGLLWAMLLELAGGAEEEAAAALFRLTNAPEKGFAGKRDPQELTDGQVSWVLNRVREEYRKASGGDFSGKPAGPPAGGGLEGGEATST